MEYTEDQIVKWIWEWANTSQSRTVFFRSPRIDWRELWELRRDNEKIRDTYARAQQTRGEAVAEGIHDITDRMIDGEIRADVARVAIDAYKWHASKLLPKVYGDRIQTEHTGEVTTKVISLGSGQAPAPPKQDSSTEDAE